MTSRASSAFGLSLTRDDTYFFVPGGSGDLLWSDSSKIQIELTKVASEIEDPQAYLTCLDNLAKAFRKVMPQFKDQLVIAGTFCLELPVQNGTSVRLIRTLDTGNNVDAGSIENAAVHGLRSALSSIGGKYCGAFTIIWEDDFAVEIRPGAYTQTEDGRQPAFRFTSCPVMTGGLCLVE